MSDTFKQDIDALCRFANQCKSLDALTPELGNVFLRNAGALAEVTYRYRMVGADTGYRFAFALDHGCYAVLTDTDAVDVTVTGAETNLLAIFQRKLNPVNALLFGKLKLNGNKTALVKLADFL